MDVTPIVLAALALIVLTITTVRFKHMTDTTTALGHLLAGIETDVQNRITRDIQVEMGWGGPPGSFDLVPTSFDVISANAAPAVPGTED